jgi:prepilin-type processing-associated H-X9-DG protein
MRSTSFQPTTDAQSPRTIGGEADRAFGSAHASGMNALFADGAVRSIAYTVPALMFRRLASIDDGETIDPARSN